MEDLIFWSIPAFFLLIGIEVVWTRGQGVYELRDSIGNLSVGLLQQILSTLTKAVLLAYGYTWVFNNARLYSFAPDSWTTWLFAFFAADLAYYAWHRMSHRVHFMWAGHVVHHQSRYYNFTVALRQNWLNELTSAPFYCLIALAGVPTHVFVSAYAVVIVYQFWIHSSRIGKLGPLEWVFNTPSHHRVHHATDAPYIDKNYAGVFIIWDRMFGTFIEETFTPQYGTLHPLRSYEPVTAYLHTWKEIARQMRGAATWGDALKVLYMPPEYRPPGVPAVEPDPPVGARNHPLAPVIFVAVLAAGVAYLGFADAFDLTTKAVMVGTLTAGLWVAGRLNDGVSDLAKR